jgi:ferrous iron transport protein A
MHHNQPIPLSQAPEGRPLELVEINAGKRLKYRLAEMGLTIGVEMTVLQDAGGPLLVCVRDSRIAIGRGMAQKLLVSFSENDDGAS